VIGIAAILSDGVVQIQGMSLTAAMITMSVFGAIVMYVMSMLSLFKLRRSEPGLERSFRAPGYPVVPGIALALALVCLAAMVWFNPLVAAIFAGLMLLGIGCCAISLRQDAPVVAEATEPA
jgi:ethanolamine permease